MAPPRLLLQNQIGKCFRSGLSLKATFCQIEGGPWLHSPWHIACEGIGVPGLRSRLRVRSIPCPTWAATTNQTGVSKRMR